MLAVGLQVRLVLGETVERRSIRSERSTRKEKGSDARIEGRADSKGEM